MNSNRLRISGPGKADHHRAEISRPKDREDYSQEGGIARQALIARDNVAGLSNAIDSMLEPVGAEVRVDSGIVGYGREVYEEEEPQRQAGQRDSKKQPKMSTHQAKHSGNIALSTDPYSVGQPRARTVLSKC